MVCRTSRIHCHRLTSSGHNIISVSYIIHDKFYLQETSAFDADLFYTSWLNGKRAHKSKTQITEKFMSPFAPRYHLCTSAVPEETLDTFETTAFSFVF